MNTRRDFIKAGLLSAGAISMTDMFAAPVKNGKPPMRFIFLSKANGTFPKVMVPPSLKGKENGKSPIEADLNKQDLPDWMNALNDHKENMTILQGVSGKMCTTGHHTWCSALGAMKATERLSSIKRATVDFELAKLFPSPFGHIELACFPSGGGNGRGNLNGIEKGFSARGPQQPNYAFGSPKIALQELYKSESSNKEDRAKYLVERKLLEFRAKREAGLVDGLEGLERAKVNNYAESIEVIRSRNKKVDAMADTIRKNIPVLDKKYLSDTLTTVDRQDGHTEILLSALTAGLTNVLSFTLDELGTVYTGLPGLEREKIGQHDIGHNKAVGKFKPEEVREIIRRQHMKVINKIITRLKSIPEGKGNMFDNTTLVYFPENGETHHSHGTEFPFLILSGNNTKLDFLGRYIRLPYHGQEGHKTLGNLWTTMLNAYGNPIKHFGDFDLSLKGDQSGAIKQFLV